MKGRRRVLTPSFDGPILLERFFVAGAASFVGTRIYLSMTGYPQIGGHGLHIAHMLWGGLLMLAAIVAMLAFLGRDMRAVAALAAGAGWGLFIDELGKFITSDVNYFFKPAISLIYATFVILFVILRSIAARTVEAGPASVAQAMELWQSAELTGWRVGEKEQVRALLQRAGAGDPAAAAMLSALSAAGPEVEVEPGPVQRLAVAAAAGYDRICRTGWFIPMIAVLAGVMVATNIAELASEVIRDPRFHGGHWQPTAFDVLKFLSTLASSLLMGLGLLRLRTDRLQGFRTMKSGILIALLLGQLLAFYTLQLLALWGLALHLVLLAGVNYAISQEERLKIDGEESADASAPHADAPLFARH